MPIFWCRQVGKERVTSSKALHSGGGGREGRVGDVPAAAWELMQSQVLQLFEKRS